jgi:hypothetical protein
MWARIKEWAEPYVLLGGVIVTTGFLIGGASWLAVHLRHEEVGAWTLVLEGQVHGRQDQLQGVLSGGPQEHEQGSSSRAWQEGDEQGLASWTLCGTWMTACGGSRPLC